MSIDPGIDLASALITVGRELAEERDLEVCADRVVATATKLIGCSWAGLAHRTRNDTIGYCACTDNDLAPVLTHSESQHGLIRHSLTSADVVTVPDIRNDDRWPGYRDQMIAETPIRAAMAFRLRLHETDLGVLALFADEPYFFTEQMLEIATVYAEHASIALSHAMHHDKISNLGHALESSRSIGIAIGILMARHKITNDQAFELLRLASQHSHRKLRDIAVEVMETGQLDPRRHRPDRPAANTARGVNQATR